MRWKIFWCENYLRLPQISADLLEQFINPCMVATDNFLHPSLYKLNLADKPYFKPQHDWYAFWCMYIKSLLLCHPYGGVHNDYDSIPQRALARILAWDSGVKYPKASYSPEMLSDNLREITERICRKGDNHKPDISVLENFKLELVQCHSCGVQFPHTRKACPQCAKVNTQQINRQVKVVSRPGKMTVSIDNRLTTQGDLVWHKMHGTTIFAIALFPRSYEVYESSTTSSKLVATIPVGKERYIFDGFAGKYLVIGEAAKTTLQIVEINSGKLVPISTTVCDLFQGRPAFACTKDALVRVHKGWMYVGKVDPILGYVENKVRAVMEDQTWFEASPTSETIFGFQRYFSNIGCFVYTFGKQNLFCDVKLPDFEPHEAILDIATYFSDQSVLAMLKTEIKGKTYTRVYVIKSQTGELISQYRVESMPSDTHRNINGKAFMRPTGSLGIVLHPTDDGVVQEVVGQDCIGKLVLFSETEQFVCESDYLITYGSGIMVVSDKTANHLTLS